MIMSLIGKEVEPFKAQAYQNGEFSRGFRTRP